MLYSNSFASRRTNEKKGCEIEVLHLDVSRPVGHFYLLKKDPHFSGVFFYKKTKGEKNEKRVQ